MNFIETYVKNFRRKAKFADKVPNKTTEMNLLETFQSVRSASRRLAMADEKLINDVLRATADEALRSADTILAANAEDLLRMNPDNPKYDRLKLTPERLEGIASDMRNVANLPSPLNLTLEESTLPNGLHL